jgi:hypothetical protein
MKRTTAVALVVVSALSLQLAGCASIVSGRNANVAIDSYPTNAHVTIRDNKGRAVASTMTPGTVSLKRNRKFFLPAKYTATIEAPGYAPTSVPINSTINPWILGNIVLGGIPGLIVDNATGAAWQPKHSEIHRQLYPLCAPEQGPMFTTNDAPSPDEPITTPHVAERTASPVQVHGAASVGGSAATN